MLLTHWMANRPGQTLTDARKTSDLWLFCPEGKIFQVTDLSNADGSTLWSLSRRNFAGVAPRRQPRAWKTQGRTQERSGTTRTCTSKPHAIQTQAILLGVGRCVQRQTRMAQARAPRRTANAVAASVVLAVVKAHANAATQTRLSSERAQRGTERSDDNDAVGCAAALFEAAVARASQRSRKKERR